MENAIIIYPNNKEDMNLYKQLAKRLKNKLIVVKEPETSSKEQFLEDLSESVQEVKLHQVGKRKLKTIEEVLEEL